MAKIIETLDDIKVLSIDCGYAASFFRVTRFPEDTEDKAEIESNKKLAELPVYPSEEDGGKKEKAVVKGKGEAKGKGKGKGKGKAKEEEEEEEEDEEMEEGKEKEEKEEKEEKKEEEEEEGEGGTCSVCSKTTEGDCGVSIFSKALLSLLPPPISLSSLLSPTFTNAFF
jgi:hypothetical protein